jgi:phenylpropionate dioxygenase-like ring-hydroxylating dioxygenase large terminal subunit
LGDDRPDLPETHYLDNRIFTDEGVFAQEQSAIFQSVWLFVCHESEVASAGDFRTTLAGGKPIVVVRGFDGEIRSFYNVCRHRGAPVVRAECGNAKAFQCFYHLWTYDLKGCLTGIAKPEGYERVSLDKSKLGLVPVRTECLYGLVFVCLHKNAEPLQDYLGEIMQGVAKPLGSVPLEVFHFHKIELKANWKLWQDNNSERYHALLHWTHRKMSPWITGRKTPMKVRICRNGHGGYWSDGEATVDYANAGLESVKGGVLPGLKENEQRVINLFPDVMINVRSNVVRLDRMIPLSAGRTLIEWRGLGVKGDSFELREERIRHHNMFWGPAGRNLPEDIIAVEAQWAAMTSDAVRYSILAREEDLNPTDDENLRAYYQEWGRRVGLRASAPFDVAPGT